MSGMQCGFCGAEQTNGLSLCTTCQETLRRAFTNTAAYYTDVDRIQPGQRIKVRSAYQSTPPPLAMPIVDKISEALDDADHAVIGWARNLQDDRPEVGQLPTTIKSACGWLESHVASIATLEWGHECLREMVQIERKLRRILDKADTGWYAGICGNEIGRELTIEGTEPVLCERHLYGTQGNSWVCCPECGRTWDAGERRDEMKRRTENEKLPIRMLARLAVSLTEEKSVERLTRRIEQWVKREQLPDYGVRVIDGHPRRVYRLGDVVDLVSGDKRPRDLEAC